MISRNETLLRRGHVPCRKLLSPYSGLLRFAPGLIELHESITGDRQAAKIFFRDAGFYRFISAYEKRLGLGVLASL